MSDNKYRILIADDEPIERMVVSKMIQQHFGDSVQLWQAENGREAIETCLREKCQVVVLDISMPGIDGLGAAEAIRREDEACSIIFLTAYDEFDFAKRALRVHALDYLLKPSSKDELIAVLEEAVRIAEEGVRTERAESGEGNEGNELQMYSDETDDRQETSESVRNQILAEQVRNYVREHYMDDICLQDVAGALHYSDAYFCRFFKQNFNKNFIMYLSEFRVEQAKELLADMTVNVKDVSRRVGYRDSNYFTKVFKRLTGLTPSEYRSKVAAV